MLSRLGLRVRQFVLGSLATTVRALIAPVALGAHGLLVDESGRVGLVRHSYHPGWSFPGGGVARGEPAVAAMLRELGEELGSVHSDPPRFFGLYTRSAGWATNVIALYLLTNARVQFRPNLEVRELIFVDPAAPPPGTSPGTLRRLAEFVGKTPPDPYW
ncbi:MAG: NUDIX domain-containing protein [Rhizomicrobium sp.]